MKNLDLSNLSNSQQELIQSICTEFVKSNEKKASNDSIETFFNEIIEETNSKLAEKERTDVIRKEFNKVIRQQIDEDVKLLNEFLPKLGLFAKKSNNTDITDIYIKVKNDEDRFMRIDYMPIRKKTNYGFEEIVGFKIQYSADSTIYSASNITDLLPKIKFKIKYLHEISLRNE